MGFPCFGWSSYDVVSLFSGPLVFLLTTLGHFPSSWTASDVRLVGPVNIRPGMPRCQGLRLGYLPGHSAADVEVDAHNKKNRTASARPIRRHTLALGPIAIGENRTALAIPLYTYRFSHQPWRIWRRWRNVLPDDSSPWRNTWSYFSLCSRHLMTRSAA